MHKKTTIISLRLPEDLAEKLALAVHESQREQAEILRDALELGLDDLFAVGLNPLDLTKKKVREMKDSVHLASRRSAKPNGINTRGV